MWWLVGIAGAYLGYRLLTAREQLVDGATRGLASKIRRNRELARKGDREAMQTLKSLDALVEKLKNEDSNVAFQIISSLQFEGLYPPSAV